MTPEIEQIDGQVNGAFIAARHGSGTGVIVLSGSSGRVDVDRAALTVANIILVAGGDDALWPSDVFAEQLSRRREEYGMPVSLIVDSYAGHRILLPGENTPRSILHAHGGTDEADARLGHAAWREVMTLL